MPGSPSNQAKRPRLVTDSVSNFAEDLPNSPISEPDSLFDEDWEISVTPALINAPPIPGFFYDPAMQLPIELADSIVAHCLATYFTAPHIDQIMLFCRAGTAEAPPTGLPPVFLSLLDTLCVLLKPTLPPNIHTLLFPTSTTLARQAIINRYEPGQGITAHVDLLNRFGDGIIGVSFASGCAMQFASAINGNYELYLPPRSVIVMSGDARYKWMHGIKNRTRDFVEGDWVDRTMRISVTFRWLLPGADVLT